MKVNARMVSFLLVAIIIIFLLLNRSRPGYAEQENDDGVSARAVPQSGFNTKPAAPATGFDMKQPRKILDRIMRRKKAS